MAVPFRVFIKAIEDILFERYLKMSSIEFENYVSCLLSRGGTDVNVSEELKDFAEQRLKNFGLFEEEKRRNGMEVVIIGSLSSEIKINECKEYFKSMSTDVNVVTPFDFQEGSLLEIQSNYISKILNADLVVAISKNQPIIHPASISDGYEERIEFEESTTYEIAIAKTFAKPVVYWKYW